MKDYRFLDYDVTTITITTARALFGNIVNYTENMLTPAERVKVYGSDFRDYARRMNFNYLHTHSNWINFQHKNTFEIRLIRFESATQYVGIVTVWRDVMCCIREYIAGRTDATTAGQKAFTVYKNGIQDLLVNTVNKYSAQRNFTDANKIKKDATKKVGGRCCECDCNNRTSIEDGGERFTTPQNPLWLCANHRGLHGLKPYTMENNKIFGTPTFYGISFGCELESVGRSSSARAYLNKYFGCIATSDCTVDIEYKPPIYLSLSSVGKWAGAVEFLDRSSDYDFKVYTERCGLHSHFGFYELIIIE